jgi:hypothetical protein
MIDHKKVYKQKFINNDEEGEEARKRGNNCFSGKVNPKKQLNETYSNKIRLILDQIKMAYSLEKSDKTKMRAIKDNMFEGVKMLSGMLWSPPKMVMSVLEDTVKVADFGQFAMNNEDLTDYDGKARECLSVRNSNQSNELMLMYQTKSIGNQSNELVPRSSSHFNAWIISSRLKNSIFCKIVGFQRVVINFALTILVITYSGKIFYWTRLKAYMSCGSGWRTQCNQISLVKEQKAKKECVETDMPQHKWKLIKTNRTRKDTRS